MNEVYLCSFWDSHLNNRPETYEVNQISFSELAGRFSVPIRTRETVEDFQRWAKEQKENELKRDQRISELKEMGVSLKSDSALNRFRKNVKDYSEKKSRVKNVGCFFAGAYNPDKKRGNNSVTVRTMIQLDLDRDMDSSAFQTLQLLLDRAGSDYLIHSTHSHTREKSRFRVYVPLKDPILDQATFEATARAFAQKYIPVDWLDRTTFEWARLMYVPSCPSDGEYLFHAVTTRGAFDASQLVLDYSDLEKRKEHLYRQRSLIGTVPENDPRDDFENRQRPRAVKAFNRAYPISNALEEFLFHVYDLTEDKHRYSFISGSASAGFYVFDGDLWAYAHDETDPSGWNEKEQLKHAVNAYDLVRTHLFEFPAEGQKVPYDESVRAMNKWAEKLEKVQIELEKMDKEQVQNDFQNLDQETQQQYQDQFLSSQTLSGTDPYLDQKTEGILNSNLRQERNVNQLYEMFLEETETDFEPISTGFYDLDKLLDGGLYAGTYFIGAVSSLGKTTFALQLADQIAASGQDVLFFSLEMSPIELMAKSISRISAQILGEERDDHTVYGSHHLEGALEMNGVLRKRIREMPKNKELYEKSIQRYMDQTGEHLFIVKDSKPLDMAKIHAYISQHINLSKRKPVVILDYLQVVQPENDRQTEKQATDKNVLNLKQISVQHNIPILTISSFNRASYYTPVSPESFKESGNIEYGADVLIGIQYKGMDFQANKDGKWESDAQRRNRVSELIADQKRNGREGRAQSIEIKVLKNRRYKTGSAAFFLYPKYNLISNRDYESSEFIHLDKNPKVDQDGKIIYESEYVDF